MEAQSPARPQDVVPRIDRRSVMRCGKAFGKLSKAGNGVLVYLNHGFGITQGTGHFIHEKHILVPVTVGDHEHSFAVKWAPPEGTESCPSTREPWALSRHGSTGEALEPAHADNLVGCT